MTKETEYKWVWTNEEAEKFEVKYCPIHGVPMKKHQGEKYTWYTHWTDTKQICYGKKPRPRK